VSGRLRVALTFDAEHPDRAHEAGATAAVVSILAERRVRASFFLQGRWVEAERDLARRIADDGHLVGNHSFYHARMPLLSDAGFRTDVRAAESIIRRRLGVDPRPWFRLPFGSGAAADRQHELLGGLGYRHVHWDFEVKEWRRRATAPQVRDGVIAGVLAHGDGAVVLLHPWPRVVPRALPDIIDALAERGATFVDLRALERLPDGRAVGAAVRS
jgi:peptidoglycan/xylan/chitin deacetylase (PgdA/CDA1 family)